MKRRSKEYIAGFNDGWAHALDRYRPGMDYFEDEEIAEELESFRDAKRMAGIRRKPKRKKQSPKQKLLTEMSQKKWKSYKRNSPKGKKTYVQIRAQVSRSQAYKKKAKRLG